VDVTKEGVHDAAAEEGDGGRRGAEAQRRRVAGSQGRRPDGSPHRARPGPRGSVPLRLCVNASLRLCASASPRLCVPAPLRPCASAAPLRPCAPAASLRPARRYHPHSEPQAPSPRERPRHASAAEEPRQGEEGPPEALVPEHAQHRARERWKAPFRVKPFPSLLQAAPILDPRGAHRLASSAAETGVEVLHQSGVRGRHLVPRQRAHEQDAPARAVGLVAGGEVGGAGGKAEAAVDAGGEGVGGAQGRRVAGTRGCWSAAPGAEARIEQPPAGSLLRPCVPASRRPRVLRPCVSRHSLPPSSATLRHFPGSNESRKRATTWPTPSR
jgi:hypothetical protein